MVVWFTVMSCGFPRPADVGPDAPSTGQTYQLLSIEPAVAAAGDTVNLEGTFAATATVTFPGGVSAPATILGAHRATVVVPSATTAGELRVTTGGATLGPLPFRRVSFALGLQNFRGIYEQAGTARQTPGFVTSRYGHTSAVVGSSLFILGGTGGGGVQASIERATINADGSLGAFATVPGVSLVTARSGHTSMVTGNSLYVIGGAGTNGILNSVERAAINVDGSLGPFAMITDVSLTTGRSEHTSTIVGNSLYVFGGAASATDNLNSVERATINADGSLSPFAIVTDVTLITARNSHSCEVIANSIFVIGGNAGNNGRLKSVERANIKADGSLGAFVTVPGTTLASARNGHASAILGVSLYVIGGSGDNGLLSTIERAAINPDGSLGAFVTVLGATLASARNGHTATVVGDFLYILGGSGNGNLINNLQWASINANGALGSFATVSGVTLPDGRNSRTSVVAGNFLYVLGGTGSSNNFLNSVARATINADGSLDSFTILSDIALVTGRSIHACAVVGNWLYVLGGSNGNYLGSIERASIGSDGTLGPFSLVSGRALVTPRAGHSITVLGNNLYVLGGTTSGGGDLLSIEHAAINADGSLGPFTIEPESTNTGHYGLTSMATENYLYLLAGYSTTNGILATVERSIINFNDGTVGPFVTVPGTTLNTKRFLHSSTVIGSYLYVLGGATMFAATSSVERAPMNADGSLGPFAALPTVTLAAGRSGHANVLVKNFLYTISGSADALNSVEQTTLP